MGTTKKTRLPRAQIAELRDGPGAVLAGILRPLTRIHIGRTEVIAAMIAGGILVVTGLMLAAFGAANQQGLAERYTAAALTDESPEPIILDSHCLYGDSQTGYLEDLWARAMAGGQVEPWNGVDDWMVSQDKASRQCYEMAPIRKQRWTDPRVPFPWPAELDYDFDGILCGNDVRLNNFIPAGTRLPDFTQPADQR